MYFKFWTLIGYSPQIYTQQSVKKEQNRKHQRAEILNNIPVKIIKTKYFDNEENRTRKLCEFAQASKSACMNFFLPERHRLFPRQRIFFQVTIRAVNYSKKTECTVSTVRSGITCHIQANHSRHEFSNHQIRSSAPTVNFSFTAYSNTPHPRVSSSSLPNPPPCRQPTFTRRRSRYQLVTFRVENFVLRL